MVVVDNAVFEVVFGLVLCVALADVLAVTVVVLWLLIVDLRIEF